VATAAAITFAGGSGDGARSPAYRLGPETSGRPSPSSAAAGAAAGAAASAAGPAAAAWGAGGGGGGSSRDSPSSTAGRADVRAAAAAFDAYFERVKREAQARQEQVRGEGGGGDTLILQPIKGVIP
jgi:hypothetical protein